MRGEMKNLRAYYSASIREFLRYSSSEILGVIHSNNISAETTIQQSSAWKEEILVLQEQLRPFKDGRIIFEYIFLGWESELMWLFCIKISYF